MRRNETIEKAEEYIARTGIMGYDRLKLTR
jgi:hypothetical protein